MEKRKQASRTPNASRNTTARSMSERQGVRGLLNLAAAFGVREACFGFGLSHASMRFGIGRTGKVKSCFCFRFNANGPGGAPFRPAQKLRCSQRRLTIGLKADPGDDRLNGVPCHLPAL
jgi:hypothetical protein